MTNFTLPNQKNRVLNFIRLISHGNHFSFTNLTLSDNLNFSPFKIKTRRHTRSYHMKTNDIQTRFSFGKEGRRIYLDSNGELVIISDYFRTLQFLIRWISCQRSIISIRLNIEKAFFVKLLKKHIVWCTWIDETLSEQYVTQK